MTHDEKNTTVTACVTGASGMVGSSIVKKLLGRGYKVRVLGRRTYNDPNVEFFKGDLTDDHLPAAFVENADLVFHCAAELNDESKMWEVNVQGTRRVLELVRGVGIRYFCFLSSIGVIGKTKTKWLDEHVPCNPQNMYERSKLAAENLVMSRDHDFQIVVLRPGNIIDEQHLGTLFGLQRNSLLSKLRIFLIGGEFSHMVHAEDVADTALFFIDQPLAGSQCFHVSYDDEPCNTNAMIWALLVAKSGKEVDKGSVKASPHLPVIFPYLIRNVRRGSCNYGNIRYTSQKLFSKKYRFKLGLFGTVARMAELSIHKC